jgi:hypothetical protein
VLLLLVVLLPLVQVVLLVLPLVTVLLLLVVLLPLVQVVLLVLPLVTVLLLLVVLLPLVQMVLLLSLLLLLLHPPNLLKEVQRPFAVVILSVWIIVSYA